MCQPQPTPDVSSKRGFGGALIIGIIRVYQLTLSSVFGRSCRYLPTCSEYTTDAVKLHGAWAGLWIGLARFARCNPLGGDGFDPAPERLPSNSRWYMPWRYGHWRTPPESVAPHAE